MGLYDKWQKSYSYRLYFTVVLGFYLKKIFISEQIPENRFGAFQRLVKNVSPSLMYLAM